MPDAIATRGNVPDAMRLADGLRAYVHQHGAAATCAVVASVLEEIRDANQSGSPLRTVADINATVLRHAMTRMVA